MKDNLEPVKDLVSETVSATFELIKASKRCFSLSHVSLGRKTKKRVDEAKDKMRDIAYQKFRFFCLRIIELCDWMQSDPNQPVLHPSLFKEDFLFKKIKRSNFVTFEKTVRFSLNEKRRLTISPDDQVIQTEINPPKSHKSTSTQNGSSKNSTVKKFSETNDFPKFKQITSSIFRNIVDMEKPQKKFKTFLNNDDKPYVPQLVNKPNCLCKYETDPQSLAKSLAVKYGMKISYHHPYIYEIDRFNIVPDEIMQRASSPVNPRTTMRIRPFKFIDNLPDFENFVEGISGETVITFDLEAHSIRSYQGFTCLLQISSRSCDYIIDTIELHDHVHVLNKIFSDPNILKIGHAVDQDIKWLQRDFNVFVVNLFDTMLAAGRLGFSRRSLESLTDQYFKLQMDKRYQLADWRQRPLSKEMIDYARMDSHCLFSIFDAFMVDFQQIEDFETEINKLLFDCKKRCLLLYEKPISNRTKVASKSASRFENHIQWNCFLELISWRENMAKILDENPNIIASIQTLISMCQNLDKNFDENIRRFHYNTFHDLYSNIYKCRDVFDKFKISHEKYIRENSEEDWEECVDPDMECARAPNITPKNLNGTDPETSFDKSSSEIEELPQKNRSLLDGDKYTSDKSNQNEDEKQPIEKFQTCDQKVGGLLILDDEILREVKLPKHDE
ncbi:Exosome complex exonuclease RRP6 [Thelohanellus kitauei]|uniref:Exosome complex exonuclease RRP6 n=1 Tax=Thelohanellus kitauei TaxID=669202 RepID=A0A0C2MMA3_THEKT|nr:Exosome complex exonuclease RRP6 [Thelohanellus kitauei]